jgi:hypothetical protein
MPPDVTKGSCNYVHNGRFSLLHKGSRFTCAAQRSKAASGKGAGWQPLFTSIFALILALCCNSKFDK